jgi:hypothetical protein
MGLHSVSNYVYPVLRGDTGLVNDAVDLFYDILDSNIEVMSYREKLKHWKEMQSIDLEFYEVFRKDISKALK